MCGPWLWLIALWMVCCTVIAIVLIKAWVNFKVQEGSNGNKRSEVVGRGA